MNRFLLIWNAILTLILIGILIFCIGMRMAHDELVSEINEWNATIAERIQKDEYMIVEQFQRFQDNDEEHARIINEHADILEELIK